MVIKVCIGSACHVKGSYAIRDEFERLVSEHGLSGRVAVEPAFCLGQCERGATVQIDGDIVTGVTLENAGALFTQRVLGAL